MKTSTRFSRLAPFASFLSILLPACSSSPGIPASAAQASDAGGDGASPFSAPLVTDAGPAFDAADAGMPSHFPFDPSNLPAGFEPNAEGDVVVAKSCAIDTDALTTDCMVEGFAFEAQVPEEDDAGTSLPDLAVLSVGSLAIAQDAQVRVKGARALVIASARDVKIAGSIDASATAEKAGPGGFSGATDQNVAGRGPGAGGAPDAIKSGGAGGSACGYGGDPDRGDAYLKIANVAPLVGGSSGGSGFQAGGGGGGAIEIVSGGTFTLEANGAVRANGGGPGFGGSGGGAGGMLLIEATNVSLAGELLANGGGGSANTSSGDVLAAGGHPGSNDLTPAPGGAGVNPGGAGAAGDVPDGTAGVYTQAGGGGLGDYGGGGGGGAGMIVVRFAKTQSGSAIASPTKASGCFDVRQDVTLKK